LRASADTLVMHRGASTADREMHQKVHHGVSSNVKTREMPV